MYEVLTDFLIKSESDPRIDKTHIALYVTLFHFWKLSGFPEEMIITSEQVMIPAKISSRSTYTKAIALLSEYGYIQYHPTMSKTKKSRVRMITTYIERPI